MCVRILVSADVLVDAGDTGDTGSRKTGRAKTKKEQEGQVNAVLHARSCSEAYAAPNYSADRKDTATHVSYNVEARNPRLRKTIIPTCSPLNGEYDCSFLFKFRLSGQKL